MTLYTYSKDTSTSSTCYDQCAVNWPPIHRWTEDNINNVKAGINGTIGHDTGALTASCKSPTMAIQFISSSAIKHPVTPQDKT